MPLSSITELALRSAVNTNSRDLSASNASSQADAIKGVATQMAQSQSSMSTNPVSSSSQSSAAIAAAVAILTVAYGAISAHMSTLKDKRLSYDKMRAAGVADFFLPKNKEFAKHSPKEQLHSQPN